MISTTNALIITTSTFLISLIILRYIAVNETYTRSLHLDSLILRVEPPYMVDATLHGLRVSYGKYDIFLPEEHQRRLNIIIIMSCKRSSYGDHVTDRKYQDIRLICQIKDEMEVTFSSGKHLMLKFLGILGDFKAKMLQFCFNSFPEPHASLLAGILFGYNATLPQEFYQALVATGLLHVIAASGYNVMWVSSFIMRVAAPFVSRTLALALGIFGICCYAILAGLSPSVLRASVMGTISLLCASTGKRYLVGISLWYTILFLVVADPFLLWSLSFQLSVLSTLSLIYVFPVVSYTLFGRTSMLGEVRETFAMTLATTLGTFPLILHVFGRVSVISVVANVALLWIIPATMIGGAIFLIFSIISRLFAGIWSVFIYALLEYFHSGILFFAELPFSSLVMPKMPFWGVVVWECVLFSCCVWIFKRKNGGKNCKNSLENEEIPGLADPHAYC